MDISAFVCVRGRERAHLATQILSVYGTVQKNGKAGTKMNKPLRIRSVLSGPNKLHFA